MMKRSGRCLCGRSPVHSRGKCKRCYEREWRASHPEYLAELRAKHKENFTAPDALEALTMAFNVEPLDLAGYILQLRGCHR